MSSFTPENDSNRAKFFRNISLHLFILMKAGAPETISIAAPVGSTLLGLSVGQSITRQVPRGRELSLRVLEAIRQPEAMEEYHR